MTSDQEQVVEPQEPLAPPTAAVEKEEQPLTAETAAAEIPRDPDAESEEMDDEVREYLEQRKAKKVGKIVLTEEEAALPPAERAALLQRKARDARLAKEREEALQAEKKRIQSQKALLESKQHLKELEAQRLREEMEREKREKKEAEERQKALLRAEYRERFGRDMEEVEEEVYETKSSREQIIHWTGKLSSRLAKAAADGDATTRDEIMRCLKTVRIYASNAKEHPLDPKYLKISKTNKAFQERVAKFPEATRLLQACGFKDSTEHLEISGYPNDLALANCIKYVDYVLKKYSTS